MFQTVISSHASRPSTGPIPSLSVAWNILPIVEWTPGDEEADLMVSAVEL